MKKWLNRLNWLNMITIGAQVLNGATQTVPDLGLNPYVLAIQGALAAVLPSLNGVGHKIAFGEPQDPAKR